MNYKSVNVAEHEDFQITLHTASSSKLIITFGGMPTGKSASGFGTGFCIKYGYDNLYVSQKKGTQYQGLSAHEFSALVAPIVEKYTEHYCYGASLGGYCALYYGSAFCRA